MFSYGEINNYEHIKNYERYNWKRENVMMVFIVSHDDYCTL